MPIEQLQMKIEFMSSVDMEHCKSFDVIFGLKLVRMFIYLLSKTEVWTLDENDDTINMKVAEPNLNRYYYYPELFIVDSDFCTKNK